MAPWLRLNKSKQWKRNERKFMVCCLSAPALSVWSRHAAKEDGLSHDEDELMALMILATAQYQWLS